MCNFIGSHALLARIASWGWLSHTPRAESLRHALMPYDAHGAGAANGCQFPPSIKGRSCQKGRGFLGETLVKMYGSKDISYVQTPKNTVNQVG